MAVMKLGMVFTDAAGSIGGTTIKRNRGLIVAYNKPRGPSIERLYSNRQLSANSFIMQSWSSLSNSERDSWVAAALLYQFPDKFGALRNLTGRELYIKLLTQLSAVGGTLYQDATSIDNSLGAFVTTPGAWEAAGGVFTLATWSGLLGSVVPDRYVAMAAIRVPVSRNYFPINKMIPFHVVSLAGGVQPFNENITASLNAVFSNVQPGQKFLLASWITNEFGFKGVPVLDEVIVAAP